MKKAYKTRYLPVLCNTLFIFGLLFLNFHVQSQNKNSTPWQDKIYKENIHTALIYKSGWEMSMPLIELNKNESLTLVFDEIGNLPGSYAWTVTHCTSDWKESDLEPFEYIEGHEVWNIEQHWFSQNTLINYIHYRIDFPNKNIKLTKSGNYIIKVFESDDPTKLIISRRFYVLDSFSEISGDVERIKNHAGERNQRVNFSVGFNNEIENPLENVTFKLLKNNEDEHDFNHLTPSAIEDNTLYFRGINELTFAGGNEYRHVDLKSFKFLSDCLERIDKKQDTVYVKVIADTQRSTNEFKPDKDLNGKNLIKLENSDKSEIMADYCYVTFELKAPILLDRGNYVISGNIQNCTFGNPITLEFNSKKNCYEKTLFLKQGYYNYLYLFNTDDKFFDDKLERYRIEGNFIETENEYTLFIYYKSYSDNYQQLIGFKKFNS